LLIFLSTDILLYPKEGKYTYSSHHFFSGVEGRLEIAIKGSKNQGKRKEAEKVKIQEPGFFRKSCFFQDEIFLNSSVMVGQIRLRQ
jgi:hypothetical protein